MQSVFSNPSELEKLNKERYSIPQFLMMENAAKSMADFIIDQTAHLEKPSSPASIIIVCGKGNNGGDGYALARLLQNKVSITLLAIEEAAAQEAKAQYLMCKNLGMQILNAGNKADLQLFEKACKSADFIVDCIFGTGFHGELNKNISEIIEVMNKNHAIKIACDIPSALEFKADYTLTMGCQKLALYSDKAKAACGQILISDLGIARELFEAQSKENNNIFLIEPEDRQLPLRKNRASHKGKFGHTAVLYGDKAGAGILAASAALNFGSGLTSLVKTEGLNNSNIGQFKISPSLMLSDSIPKKTSCISLGSGFSDFSDAAARIVKNWFSETENPALVLDAGMLTSPESPDLLAALNKYEKARIVLTPHLGELSLLLKNCKADFDFSVNNLADNPEARIAGGLYLSKLFPKSAVIMKSANTYIAYEGKIYIIADGSPSLSKGGSGDILAGLTASLLAQGYSAASAAITAAEHHALLSKKIGDQAYNLTPESLLASI